MSPIKKAAWINLILQLTPIIIGIIKPELAPLANQLSQSIAAAEDQHGDRSAETKLNQVINDVKPNLQGLSSVNDVKKVVEAIVDTVNIIHDTKKEISK